MSPSPLFISHGKLEDDGGNTMVNVGVKAEHGEYKESS
jgi:hypothetical protein